MMIIAEAKQPVLIAGAGLASLLLAQSLFRSRLPFQIFEKDTSLNLRGQGYRLRLSSEGLEAIESVLDEQKFKKFYEICSKTGGGGLTSWNAITGQLLTHDSLQEPQNLGSRDGKVVGIARGEMRNLFMDGIEDFVQWNKHVTSYELAENGVRVLFADGTRSEMGCLLVGGEGIRSQVAKQLSAGQLKVYDLGVRGIHGQAPTTAFKAFGEGVFNVIDKSNNGGHLSVTTNVRPGELNDPNVQFGWTMIGSPGMIELPVDEYTIVGKTAANVAKRLTRQWHEKFRPLFDTMNESEAAFWKLTCSSPQGVPAWKNDPRVTVIGDAVHSMTPAGGMGANTALRDSALLGKLLYESGGYTSEVTAEYEKGMRLYANEAVSSSYRTMSKQLNVTINEFTRTV